MSGCRELNSVNMLPKHAYYRYTTPRVRAYALCFSYSIVPRVRIELTTQGFSLLYYLGFPKDRTISSPLNLISTESGARGGVIVGLTR